MKKWLRATLALFVLLCIAALALHARQIPGWKRPEELTLAQSFRIQEALRPWLDLSGERDGMELALIHEGLTVVDSDPVYPSYLYNPDPVRAFAAGSQETCSIFQVREDLQITHLFFTREVLVATTLGDQRVKSQEVLPLYEAVVSDWDSFYYRCYPLGDPHYIDYAELRLLPANRKYYDLTRKYILPIGYQMVNLFLCDWTKEDWGDVCLNDTFEYLYALKTGEDFPWWTLSPGEDSSWYLLDEDLFEGVLLSYFSLDVQTLRALCRYDADAHAYPWRPMTGNDVITLDHEARQPEVVSAAENPDGTLTLTVQVGYPDKRCNNRFTHQVTIRPTAEGFFFTGNHLTYVSEYGLPTAASRFSLNGAGT